MPVVVPLVGIGPIAVGKIQILEVRIGPPRLRGNPAEPTGAAAVDRAVEVRRLRSLLLAGGFQRGRARASLRQDGHCLGTVVVASPGAECLLIICPGWPRIMAAVLRGGVGAPDLRTKDCGSRGEKEREDHKP